MYRDNSLVFAEAQAITVAAVSQNVVDMGAVRDIGTGEPIFLVVVVLVAFTAGGITLTVTLQGDSTAALPSPKTKDVMILPALTAAGAIYYSQLDPSGMSGNSLNSTGQPLSQRYLRLNFTPTGGTFTTCTVTAFIAHTIQQVNYYASGFVAAA